MKGTKHFEVIIIGGSYAGLSAAMALGRSLRHVLIIDSGLRCNRQTPHSHNFLTQDGEDPSVIAGKAKKEVLNYDTLEWIDDLAVSGSKTEDGFTITTHKGDEFSSKKLLFASGIKDIMPEIPGFAACWGISVVHCPYCHGYEFRNQDTAILANGPKALHLASLVNNLTKKLSILTMGKANFSEAERVKLDYNQIEIIEEEVAAIEHENGRLKCLNFKNGTNKEIDVLYAALPFTQSSDIPTALGCELTETGFIKVSEMQATSVPGVYACGDNSGMLRSIANAVYSGNLAGAILNKALIDDLF
jgi:thioredoxin reductase